MIFILIMLLIIPMKVYGMSDEEAYLFGLDNKGNEIELTVSDGWPKTDAAIEVTRTYRNGKVERVDGGRCELHIFNDPYSINCKSTEGLLAGVDYKGYELKEFIRPDIQQGDSDEMKQVENVYQQYLKKHGDEMKANYGDDGAKMNSYYKCIRNCGPEVPEYLLFMFQGD